jgi:hypothetical protein
VNDEPICGMQIYVYANTSFRCTGRSKSLYAPDDYSTKKKTLKSAHSWWFEDGHHRIHSECGLCYTEHGLQEHSSACQ